MTPAEAAAYVPAPVDRVRQALIRAGMAKDLRREDLRAAVYWLSAGNLRGRGHREERVRMAHQLVCASVWAQAGLLGLVDCSRCGDRGCEWCRGGVGR